MSYSSENEVLVDRHDRVLKITINRPDVLNAVNHAVHQGIGAALAQADADPEIRAVVVTGAGDKAFCAGADLKSLAQGENWHPEDPAIASWGFAGFTKHAISKPTIAAVNGLAAGGGTEIVLAADLAIASDTAKFGLPEVKHGLVAGSGGAFRVVRQLPRKVGMEILLTGAMMNASRAEELGLVNRVVPQADVVAAAMELAASIAANAPLAVQASKRIALGLGGDNTATSEVDSWTINDRELKLILESDDAREGPLAFLEKRAPVWRAR